MADARGSGPSWRRLLPELPEARTMAAATLVYTTGSGMFMVASVLYFTRIVGLSATSVGVGLTIAGLFGLLAGIPLGHLADRRGGRELLIWLLALAGLAFGVLVVATTWWAFVVAMSVALVLDRGSAAVRAGLIASSVKGHDRVRTRAYLRSVTNVGLAVGGGVAGVALHLDTREAYVAVLLGNAASCLGAAWITRRYPHVPPVPRERAVGITTVFRDRPYVLMTLLMSAMAVQYAILDVGMPLWVTEQTDAPRVLVSVLFIVNTVVVVLFQVGASTRVTSVTTAARTVSLSGIALLVACLAFAAAGGRSVGLAVVLLVVAALMHVLGELMQAAAHFYLSQEMASDHAQGQYQGMASTGFSLAAMLAPTVIVLLPVGLGAPGWVVLGVLLALLGFALLPVIRWTASTRERYAHVV
ncbi:MFS transporter [Solicola sp. PLA-1-18]|uniref:MFS transporter n=1 Tax=Solicola sp. PLA-1-18 TaxID=3380532 RepID=UPI003B7E120E